MDIAGLSMAMSQSKLMEQASLSVMELAMNTGKENAAEMTKMLEQSSNPNLGRNLDVRI